MRSNLLYREIFQSKYGKEALKELESMVLLPPELVIDYNTKRKDELVLPSNVPPTPTSISLGMEMMGFGGSFRDEPSILDNEDGILFAKKNERVRKNVEALAVTYRTTQQYLGHMEMVLNKQLQIAENDEDDNGTIDNDDSANSTINNHQHDCTNRQQLSLTPTLFWYDNVHICETEHYRSFIFDKSKRMVAKGGFVEDKLSPVIVSNVERYGLRDGHSDFGCYLVDDHTGYFYTGHLDGGSYMSPDDRKEMVFENGYNANMNKK